MHMGAHKLREHVYATQSSEHENGQRFITSQTVWNRYHAFPLALPERPAKASEMIAMPEIDSEVCR